MPWPLLPLAIKFISLKFIKGAVVGIARYIHKVSYTTALDARGEPLGGVSKAWYLLRHAAFTKENTIFLILMLGNFFFGLQELCVWCWNLLARRLFNEYRTWMPSALQEPHALSHALKEQPWRLIWPALGRWLAIASLFYWPKPVNHHLRLAHWKKAPWVEIFYDQHRYLARNDRVRAIHIRGLHIVVNALGDITVTTPTGLTATLVNHPTATTDDSHNRPQ
ncbi:MAG: hypothetical protein FD130_849 [Halothiobacillaceae bacterium]|nr:MAG: hypothetical protein FD130_849 [Halothiobacillaceae bacterium]